MLSIIKIMFWSALFYYGSEGMNSSLLGIGAVLTCAYFFICISNEKLWLLWKVSSVITLLLIIGIEIVKVEVFGVVFASIFLAIMLFCITPEDKKANQK